MPKVSINNGVTSYITIPTNNQYSTAIMFMYSNHEGKVERRSAATIDVFYGTTEYYPEPQWLLKAWCLDRQAERIFAMNKMTPVVSDETA